MPETVPLQEQYQHTAVELESPARPERLVWAVLVIFCCVSLLLCGSISYYMYRYLFESSTPLEAELQVARGTIGITSPISQEESAERVGREINSVTTLSTDEQSLGILSILDEDGTLFASITIRPETNVTHLRSTRPRFSMGGNDLSIELGDLQGRLDIMIIEQFDYEVQVRVRGPEETVATLRLPGRYQVEVNDAGLVLTNHSALFAQWQSAELSRLIPRGYQVSLSAENENQVTVERSYANLINDPTFERYFDFLAENAVENARWSCINFNDLDNDTPGHFRSASKDGLETMRFVRLGEIKGHGETRCFYQFLSELGEFGLFVSEYEYVGIQSTFMIQGQSLGRCGFRGSECPIMLRIDYVDSEGNDRRWFQGFYIPHPEDNEQSYPLRCSNCPSLHERVSAEIWYQYDSGNLFTILPENARPAELINLQAYASGHQYDVFLAEISLQVRMQQETENAGAS